MFSLELNVLLNFKVTRFVTIYDYQICSQPLVNRGGHVKIDRACMWCQSF